MTDDPRSSRRSERRPVHMPAQCRTASGGRGNVELVDLTPEGCRIAPGGLMLRIGQRVMITPENFQPLPAVVRWLDSKFAGLQFEQPLYGPVAEHLQAAFRAATK